MDLKAAKADGISFFTYKATESTNIRHAHFGEALTRARDAGVPFLGAYAVPRTPGNGGAGTIQQQVAFFVDYIKQAAPWLLTHPGGFLQTDLEHWGYDNVAPSYGCQFNELAEKATGLQSILYAPKWAYENSIPGNAPLWASNYGTNPAVKYRDAYPGDGSVRWVAYSGRIPVILQYGSKTIIGSQHTCDANAFRGGAAEFAKLIGKVPALPGSGEERMITLIKLIGGDGTVWAADGVYRSIVPTKSVLGKQSWMKRNYPPDYSYKLGEVQNVNDLDAFGRDARELLPELSDAQLALVLEKLASRPALTPADLEAIEAKVKEAMREGSAAE
jgi:hypothetical protein